MKIHMPLIEVKDSLITVLSEGYGIVGYAFSAPYDVSDVSEKRQDWVNKTANYLAETFPTRKELGQFLYSTGAALMFQQMAPEVSNAVNDMRGKVTVLEDILAALDMYYQFEPEDKRVYIQRIDSFEKVRGINPEQVVPFLHNGALDVSEQTIKEAFAAIIGESYVPKDFGGELHDLYTSQILLNGERAQTTIIFKGPGTVRGSETRLNDLGKGPNQLVRMFQSLSSKLYIVQSVKPVHKELHETLEAFVGQQWTQGNRCYYCIISGQDTATILYAYGYLPQ